MPTLLDLALDASVGAGASFGEAVSALANSEASAIAIVDEDDRVIGLLDERRVLKGLFPAYLGELTHTAFADDDEESIRRRRQDAMREPARRFASDPVTVEVHASFTHVAERFMHCALQGIALVERGRYRGVISIDRFVRAFLGPET